MSGFSPVQSEKTGKIFSEFLAGQNIQKIAITLKTFVSLLKPEL
jgi:hypothetical protein